MQKKSIEIVNKLGLHARASAKLTAAGGAQHLPMEQRRGVAWDPSFPARIRARVGGDAVELEVVSTVDAA